MENWGKQILSDKTRSGRPETANIRIRIRLFSIPEIHKWIQNLSASSRSR